MISIQFFWATCRMITISKKCFLEKIAKGNKRMFRHVHIIYVWLHLIQDIFLIMLHLAENIYFEETTALGYTKYDATLKAYNLRMCFEFKSWFLFATYLFVVYGKGFSTII